MARLPRVLQRLFGSTAGPTQISQYGSFAAGAPLTTTNPAVMQALSQWLQGWNGAIVGNANPTIEDMNSLFYVAFYQLAYLMQAGIPEWDATTTYYTGSFASDGSGGVYVSLTDNNLNNPVSDTANWSPTNKSFFAKNYIINGNFDYWQRGIGPTSFANGVTQYVADRWYSTNILGTSGTVEYTKLSPTLDGSAAALRVQVATPPSVPSGPGVNLAQTIDNPMSLELMDKSASFSVWIKATGNVDQVRVLIRYNTTETLGGTGTLGLLDLTINSSTFTQAVIPNINIGSAMTLNGVILVTVTATSVSSGNLYDNSNGFIVEQAMLNVGPPAAFVRNGDSTEAELAACRRFFYRPNCDPTTGLLPITDGNFVTVQAVAAGSTFGTMSFPVPMRIAPTVIQTGPNPSFTLTVPVGSRVPMSSNSFDFISTESMRIAPSTSTGLNAGDATTFGWQATDATIDIDAEIV